MPDCLFDHMASPLLINAASAAMQAVRFSGERLACFSLD
jgi:hypothetical protein